MNYWWFPSLHYGWYHYAYGKNLYHATWLNYPGVWEGQVVAVKHITHHSAEGAKRAGNEVKVAMQLDHPNVVRCLYCEVIMRPTRTSLQRLSQPEGSSSVDNYIQMMEASMVSENNLVAGNITKYPCHHMVQKMCVFKIHEMFIETFSRNKANDLIPKFMLICVSRKTSEFMISGNSD